MEKFNQKSFSFEMIHKQEKDYLERVFFYFIYKKIDSFLKSRFPIGKTIIFLMGLVLLIPILISIHISDPVIVWKVRDYEKPSLVYGYNQKGEKVLYAEFYSQNRKIIHLTRDDFEKLDVVKTFIAAEDTRFREHFGIDIPGIIRAFIINILAGKIKEGASTITQQTARLRFLHRERTLIRKLREASLALFLEFMYPKYKILEIYFNEVPLGHGTLGIEAASRFYFNKSFRKLNIGEASVLSSLTTRPNTYSPLKNPLKSMAKMKVTFKRLVENGEITIQQAEKEYQNIVKKYIMVLNRYPDESSYTKRLNLFPYASAYLLKVLPEKIKKQLTTGGYKIYTTLNVEKQAIAEKELQDWLKKLNRKKTLFKKSFTKYEIFDEHFNDSFPLLKIFFGIADFKQKITKEQRDFQIKYLKQYRDELILLNYLSGEKNIINALENNLKNELENPAIKTDYIEGALVSINPINGKLEAIVGGSRFVPANQLLRFLSKRQPGSALKPFLYSAGIDYLGKHRKDKEHGLTAATLLDDSPITFIERDLSEYEPENYGGSYLGPIRVREALVLSRNAAAVRAYLKIGSHIVNSYLEKVLSLPEGVLPKEAAVALGSYEVSPLQLATAYTVFPRNGSIIKPYFIEKIEDSNGNVIYKAKEPEVIHIFLPETMFIMKSILRDVVRRGTGKLAYIPGIPVYGKTGTSNRFTNAWFAGFTPYDVTVIYIGYDKNKSLGYSGSGGSIAAPVWRKYMQNVVKTFRYSFPGIQIPENVIYRKICSLTGKIPYSQKCNSIGEYFIIGTEPKKICEVHSKPIPEEEISKPDLKIKIEIEEDL